jgi:hypothetical protein
MLIRPDTFFGRVTRRVALLACACAALSLLACNRTPKTATPRSFGTPEDAVKALIDAAKAKTPDDLLAMFAPDGQQLVDATDPASARRNRQVFVVAIGEGWRLVDRDATTKELIVGNEGWPFPVPLVKSADGWRFDTAAGKEEVLARRIGRNELAVIRVCRVYVTAQRLYARDGHDGKPAGVYAATFRSAPGQQNGLYWPAAHNQKRSPLGDLVAQAAEEGRVPVSNPQQPSPFHGYFFKILTAQGGAAAGGARDYIVNGNLTGGFALVAWPAEYNVTGVMTFVVNQDGTVRETDLGPGTDAAVKTMTLYNPEPSWEIVQ